MAAWLNYIHENYPNQLKYLGMGNEPWGGCWTQFGRENPAGYLDSWYDPFNAAIPDVFSGKIIRIAAAGYTDENVCDTRWTETVVQREVGKAEGLSWHFYTTMSWTEGQKGSSFNFGETEYYNILDRAFAMARQAKKVMDIMDKHDPGYTMGLQPDEWGAWYDQIQGMGLSYQQSTIRDAQLTAQHFNFFNNNCKRIRLSQSAQPVNAIHALFLTDRSTTAMVKTPSFYVYKLYVPHHNARMVPSTLICRKVKNLDVLTASASLDSSNKLHISISNIHATDEQSLAITLNGGNYKEITGQIVNGPAINSYNDYNTEETVNLKPFASSNFSMDGNKVNVTMPAHSVVMLELSPQGTGTVNQPIRIQKQCSIKALPGERIVFTHGFLQPTPITVSLFTIDGKTVVPSFRTVTEAGKNSLVWHPEMRSLGNNIFIVRMVAGSVTESQRLALLPKE
jgi:alpha-N-arabinofuranosidase